MQIPLLCTRGPQVLEFPEVPSTSALDLDAAGIRAQMMPPGKNSKRMRNTKRVVGGRVPGTCRAKKRARQSRRRQPLSVPDPRRPPSWPAGFQGPRPWVLRRGARGGSGAEATETCLGCAAATPLLLGRSAPNPRPCPQASAAKQNKLVQASCCATQSRVSRDRMRAADGRRLRSPGGRNQRAARPKPGFGGSRSLLAAPGSARPRAERPAWPRARSALAS